MRNLLFAVHGCLAGAALLVSHASSAWADTLVTTTSKDNTIIEDPSGYYSAGKAQYFFAGRVGQNGGGTQRRGAIAFDLASIPPGSTVQSVSLKLYCSTVGLTSAFTVGLHRFTASWGEGNSVAFGGGGASAEQDDVTWEHRFYPDVLWSVPGGEFVATASASRSVSTIGTYTWRSTPELVADVQAWVDDPASNFGWCVKGNETVLQASKRFDSREAAPATRPQLTVVYLPPNSNPYDLDHDGVVGAVDLSILINQWGTGGSADFDGDGLVGASDLAGLLSHWGS